MSRSPSQRLSSCLLVGCLILLATLVALGATLPWWAGQFGRWLSLGAPPIRGELRADAIIVLGGNTLKRTKVGIELYQHQVAPRFAITGFHPLETDPDLSDAQKAHDRAVAAGVPANAIALLETNSTVEDAQQVSQYVQDHQLQHLIIVSDWSHARRAICTIRYALQPATTQLDFVAIPSDYSSSNWWQYEEGAVNVFTEIVKLGLYVLKYRVPVWNCLGGDLDFLSYPVLIVIGCLLGTLGVEGFRRYAVRRNHLDIPNERSSHSTPIPRGGGVGIVLVVLGLWFASLALWSAQVDIPATLILAYALAAGLVALIGWLDDQCKLPVKVRLPAYLLISVAFLSVVGTVGTVYIPVLSVVSLAAPIGFLLCAIWMLGFLNIFNFMDGIDGIAGTQALVAGLFWLLLLIVEGQAQLGVLAALLIATSLGFLFHNAPPARIFMGDVGSTFLGFTLATLPIMAYQQMGNPRLLPTGVLFVAPFVFDGALTIIRRAIRRENVFAAHQSHLYQRLVLAGHSHAQVTKLYSVLAFVSGIGGVIYYGGSELSAGLVLIVLGLMYLALTVSVYVIERRRLKPYSPSV